MKRFYYLLAVLLAVVVYVATTYALTAEEMLLLKRGGISDEKILEIQRKEGSAPAPKINPFDWNEDGKKDIISGSKSGRVYVYLNTGTNLQPIFGKTIEIEGVEIMRRSDPYIADWNNDGKKDILVGSNSGEISVFINKGTNQQPIFGAEIKLNGGSLDVGYDSSPTMVDWNGDGKKDLVVGNRNGDVFVFLNVGEDLAPEFPTNGMKTDIKVHGYATPFIVDWNNDGKFDVVCGSEDGKIYIFINEGDNKNPKFGKERTLQVNNKEFKLQSPTSVIAVDWDDDGKTDLLVSNRETKEKDPGGRENIISLGIYLLLNTGTKEKPEFKELKEIKGKFWDDTVL
ncbi:MAG: VCBS repeat-containing protein [Nitrospirota bacterium]